jgi:hypothetical protein
LPLDRSNALGFTLPTLEIRLGQKLTFALPQFGVESMGPSCSGRVPSVAAG